MSPCSAQFGRRVSDALHRTFPHTAEASVAALTRIISTTCDSSEPPLAVTGTPHCKGPDFRERTGQTQIDLEQLDQWRPMRLLQTEHPELSNCIARGQTLWFLPEWLRCWINAGPSSHVPSVSLRCLSSATVDARWARSFDPSRQRHPARNITIGMRTPLAHATVLGVYIRTSHSTRATFTSSFNSPHFECE